MKQEAKTILRNLLFTGDAEIENLLNSEIDIEGEIRALAENAEDIEYNNLMHHAFWHKVNMLFDSSEDFNIVCNGLASSILIKEEKYDYYREHFASELEEIEDYMNMEFEIF